ncbi:polyketide synthase [Pseudomonas sp. NFXW11]|uniref:beta-ketoacyl synthase N-terminal-like domain-containing protein n=1 Tax=Pseudomonas sp. NFXW11 TaxID=2819531 RepID=UPI003CEDC28A
MTASHRNHPPLVFSAMAGTFPGAKSIEALWELLAEGASAPSHCMLQRWQLDREHIYHPRPGEKDRVYLHRAHCLEDDEQTPSLEQGRQLGIGLKVLQQLLAQAGPLQRQRTALIVATSWSDESYFVASAHPQRAPRPGHTPAGQIAELARQCDLGGPALTVDTACSSFTYALDMGRALMASQQADQVIVMALNTLMPAPLFLGFSQLTAFSPRGHLQAFGAEADGIVPGECAVAFLLEPLERALEADRQPLGVLRALGLSADGAEGSTFAPGKQAQFSAYQRAWSGLDPASVNYIECHGTGTPLGDATELGSLQHFFGPYLGAEDKIRLGSIKSHIGHPLAAAGGPALAKALMMLRHNCIPPQADYPISAKLAPTCLQLAEPIQQALGSQEQPSRIGISSFGFGGANAHLVLEQYRPQAKLESTGPALEALIPLDLMVVEAEAALGGAPSLQGLRQALQQPAPTRAFPRSRFGRQGTTAPPLRGHFLAENLQIDTEGYGMGPKPLGHIDPFKLLLADRVGQLLRRLPGVARSDRSAIVMCCNMGGESFTNAYSAAEHFFRQGQGQAPGIEVADVASMLPSLLSGYPAKFFDLRGFHQTLAGSAGLFWHSLLAAPQWLDQGIDTLLLGAGRFISGATELAALRDEPLLQGEGLGVIALRRYRADGPQPALLRLHAGLPGSAASDPQQARTRLGISDGASLSCCQLQGARAHQDNILHAATGYLAEASGMDTLLQLLLQAPGEHLIEVRDGERVLFWLHAEGLAPWQAPAPSSAKSPFTLRFADPQAQALAPIDHPLASIAVPQLPLAEGVDLLALSDTLAQTLASSLELRCRALRELLAVQPQGQQAVPSPDWRREERNCVISHVLRRSAQSLNAQLRVDEGHGYFFDHPLDHVPGILLIEAVLQLMEYAVPELQGEHCFIQHLNIKFQRYVLKERPVDIELQEDNGQFVARVMQNEQLMCVCTLRVAAGQPSQRLPAAEPVLPCRRQDWLHKARGENVLVGDIDPQARVRSLPVPAGQFFEDGHPRYHSMVYFLEIARQAYMQIAHGALAIPLNTPMNLLVLNFDLARPLERGQTLTLAPQDPLGQQAQAFKTNRMVIELFAAGQLIGSAGLTAQVLGKQAQPA